MDVRRALLTGASGFLGRVVAEHLARTHAFDELISLGRTRSHFASRNIEADLSVGPLELSDSVELETVFHIAGLAHVLAKTPERQPFIDVNAEGTRRLLEALERHALPRSVVLISSVAVYGAKEGEGLDERTERRATDPYGESKRQAEDLASEWAKRLGVTLGIVRLPLIAGPGAPGNLGALFRALKRRRYPGIGKGEARRSMVLATDVARILEKIAEVGGTYHLTDGRHPSFRELEAAICHALGQTPPPRLALPLARGLALGGDALGVVGVPAPFSTSMLEKMTKTLTFSDQKARRELGWRPASVVETAADWVTCTAEPAATPVGMPTA